jgi:hypothetical protein
MSLQQSDDPQPAVSSQDKLHESLKPKSLVSMSSNVTEGGDGPDIENMFDMPVCQTRACFVQFVNSRLMERMR